MFLFGYVIVERYATDPRADEGARCSSSRRSRFFLVFVFLLLFSTGAPLAFLGDGAPGCTVPQKLLGNWWFSAGACCHFIVRVSMRLIVLSLPWERLEELIRRAAGGNTNRRVSGRHVTTLKGSVCLTDQERLVVTRSEHISGAGFDGEYPV